MPDALYQKAARYYTDRSSDVHTFQEKRLARYRTQHAIS